jgi:hypothetical protein
MLRTLLALLLGLGACVGTVMGIEMLGHAAYPAPAGLDPRNPDHIAAVMAAMPPAAFAWLAVAWMAGAFAGGLVAALVAHTANRFVYVVPGLLVAAGTVMMAKIAPHPQWLLVVGIAGGPIAAWLGGMLGRKLRTPRAAAAGEWRGGLR